MHLRANARAPRSGTWRAPSFVPRSRRTVGVLLIVALLAVGATTSLAQARDPGATSDVGPTQQFVSGADVVDALRGAGLSVTDVTAEPVAGSPSGPPATEREALRFTVANGPDHPLTGRVLVFADAHGLQQKANWFRRAGVTVVQHRNVLVWLDADLDAQTLARYRQAVAGMR